MALFNEILAGRFNRFAQKHFSMKGREGSPTLAADIMLDMPFHSGEESRLHEGWDLFARNVSFGAAGAGNLSVLELRNPLTSGAVAVMYFAQVAEAAVTTVALSPFLQLNRNATTDQGTLITNVALDRRTLRTGSALIMSNNAAAVAPIGGTAVGLVAQAGPANTMLLLMPTGLEVPLLPGDALTIFTGNTNVASGMSMFWRERPLESSETT